MSELHFGISLFLIVMFGSLFYGFSFFCRKQFILLNKKLDFIISENEMIYPNESCLSAKANMYIIEGKIDKAILVVIDETGCSIDAAKGYIERQKISLTKFALSEKG